MVSFFVLASSTCRLVSWIWKAYLTMNRSVISYISLTPWKTSKTLPPSAAISRPVEISYVCKCSMLSRSISLHSAITHDSLHPSNVVRLIAGLLSIQVLFERQKYLLHQSADALSSLHLFLSSLRSSMCAFRCHSRFS